MVEILYLFISLHMIMEFLRIHVKITCQKIQKVLIVLQFKYVKTVGHQYIMKARASLFQNIIIGKFTNLDMFVEYKIWKLKFLQEVQ